MIDSINFIIKEIDITDLNNDIMRNAKTKTFFNQNESNSYIKNGINFCFKDVCFIYYYNSHTLIIKTNAHKILNKRDVTLNDKNIYEKILESILNEVIIGFQNFQLELNRIDYCVDLKLNENIRNYLYLLNTYNINVFSYMKKYKDYESSIYLATKQGKHNINIYSRYEKTNKSEDLGILRLEVQNKKRLVKSELNKFGVAKELDNYWSINAMQEHYFNIIERYCYMGDYYKREISNTIIDNSEFNNNMKVKLKQFLLDVETHGLEKIRNSTNYNTCKINNRIQQLNLLNINPIPLPQNFKDDKLEGLLHLVKKISSEKYFI